MSKKFTVISRDELIKLYKFGSLNILCTYMIDNDGDTSQKLASILDILPFDDEVSYLVLKFNYLPKQAFNVISVVNEIKIDEVDTIYTLSEKARQWYSVKFNPKIQFHEIDNIDIQEILAKKEIINMENGARSIFKMYENSLIEQDLTEESLPINLKRDFLKNHLVGNHWNEEYQDFYLDLMLYTRKNTLPEKDVSFLYDMFILFILKGRNTVDLAKHAQGEFKLNRSAYHYSVKELNIKNEKNSFSIYKNIKTINNFSQEYVDINNLVVGVIFLKIRKLLDIDYGRKGKYREEIKNIVSDFQHEYKKQLSIALYLTGIFFGYKNLYDEYYDFLDLAIFNSQNINTLEEPTMNELENKISELEKELEIYKKEKEDNNPTIQSTASESSTQEDFEINLVSTNDDIDDEEQSEDQLTTISTPIEDNITPNKSLANEELESIKDFLNYLNEEALVNIWMKAGSKNKKDIENESKETLIDHIMEHESSCLTIKELLQTFYHDVLVSVLFSTDKKKFVKNKLKILEKEELINNLMTAYKSRVI